jgi:hypothetical protein
MKKPDHWSSCNQLQSGPVLVFFPVAQLDLETLTPNAYATDLDIWVSLRPPKTIISKPALTIQDRIQQAADKITREDPHAPWELPGRLSDMKELWGKQCLPTCWKLKLASLPSGSRKGDGKYVVDTYQFVLDYYDGGDWAHHLALIIAICFSTVVPDICFPSSVEITSQDSLGATNEIRNMEWVPAQSASHRGTVALLPFIVMMSTTLIGFWDVRCPLAKHIKSNNNVLGKHWTSKHGTYIDYFCVDLSHSLRYFIGPKQINALNFIRMGLAIAKTSGVSKNAKFNSNWFFKPRSDLKALYTKIIRWLTSDRFGEYQTISCLFGENIARKLAQEQQFLAPVG